MDFDRLTDANIATLINLPKQVKNPAARWQLKPGHKQRNYKLESGKYYFEIYLRQNLNDSGDFSCGLKIIKPDGQPLTLLRYNGKGHRHGEIAFEPHIHQATHSAIAAGRKPEFHAEKTKKYDTLIEALACLLQDAAVSGLPYVHKRPTIFLG